MSRLLIIAALALSCQDSHAMGDQRDAELERANGYQAWGNVFDLNSTLNPVSQEVIRLDLPSWMTGEWTVVAEPWVSTDGSVAAFTRVVQLQITEGAGSGRASGSRTVDYPSWGTRIPVRGHTVRVVLLAGSASPGPQPIVSAHVVPGADPNTSQLVTAGIVIATTATANIKIPASVLGYRIFANASATDLTGLKVEQRAADGTVPLSNDGTMSGTWPEANNRAAFVNLITGATFLALNNTSASTMTVGIQWIVP